MMLRTERSRGGTIVQAIDSPNIRDQVYARLKQAILSHSLAPGAQLVTKDLARQLRTSTTPVIQAILRLSEEGLVDVLPRRGTFVVDITREGVGHLFDACEGVEAHAARLAIRRMTDDGLRRLEQLGQGWTFAEQSLRNADEDSAALAALREKDSQFHCGIVELSGNPYLIATYQRLDAQVWAFVRMKFGRHHGRLHSIAAEGHARILQGLRERDEERAVRAVHTHTQEIFAQYAEELGSAGRGA
jgi:GntR family transcriptional regulator, rspAB operon transcriptional repressor